MPKLKTNDPLVEKLKRRSKADFKGRHYEATLILQAVSWYLRYPLSYRDIEELFLERGLEVDHSTLNRWGKGFGFAGTWTVCEQNRLLAICFGLPQVNKA